MIVPSPGITMVTVTGITIQGITTIIAILVVVSGIAIPFLVLDNNIAILPFFTVHSNPGDCIRFFEILGLLIVNVFFNW